MEIVSKYINQPQDYLNIWQQMREFVDHRTDETPDEIWFLEHKPVFTLGHAGKPEHIIDAYDIPVVKTDRGGQVTYHGPGFLMAYLLLDLNRRQLNSRQLVTSIERAVIQFLTKYNIEANSSKENPGIYVAGNKIASLGLRISKGYSYHGLCLNVNGDLTPFSYINPCGIADQKMTSLQQLGVNICCQKAASELLTELVINIDSIG